MSPLEVEQELKRHAVASHANVSLDDVESIIKDVFQVTHRSEGGEYGSIEAFFILDDKWATTEATCRVIDNAYLADKGLLDEFSHAIKLIPLDTWKKFVGVGPAINSAVIAMLDHEVQEFVDNSISVEGRGHFLAPIDGRERYQIWDGVQYYIYKVA